MVLNLTSLFQSTPLMVEHSWIKRALYEPCYLYIYSIYGSQINIIPILLMKYLLQLVVNFKHEIGIEDGAQPRQLRSKHSSDGWALKN